MKDFRMVLTVIFAFFWALITHAQPGNTDDIFQAPAEKRLAIFWKDCAIGSISDHDSVAVHSYLDKVINKADSSGDKQLKTYATWFKKCWRIIFSNNYEKYFAPNDYQSVINILSDAALWAQQSGYPLIAADCEHYKGEVYYRANRFGLAFESLLKADEVFKQEGYHKVANAGEFLYSLGLRFYQFEEYDKALESFVAATNYEFYVPRTKLNSLNAIGLIYARRNDPAKAITFFRSTISKAWADSDTAWVGIGAGNLGNVFFSKGMIDSALFYHRLNYHINSGDNARAPEDAAKTALSIATLFLRKANLDSAMFYVDAGKKLAGLGIVDSTEALDFKKRLLKVLIAARKFTNDYQGALQLTDSLAVVEQHLRNMLDNKLLSRAVEKTDALSYQNSLALLQSRKNVTQLRLYISMTSLLIGLLLVILISRDRSLREKRRMQLAEKDKQILVVEKLRAEDGLRHSKDLLVAYIDTIKEKTTLIDQLEKKLTNERKAAINATDSGGITSDREKLMASTILTENEWQQFKGLFEQVYPGFSYRLRSTYPELSPAESRFIYLTKLNLSSREMATMLGNSVDAIHKLRYRLRKKLNLEEASNFEVVIQKIS